MIGEKELSLEDDLDIVEGGSGLPVDEICFEANGTMEKSCLHNIKSEKKRILQNSEGKVVTSDNENNKVLVNIVETQEPAITTRVENEEIKISENVRDLFKVKNSSPRPKLKSINKRDNDMQIIGSISHNTVPDWTNKPGIVKHKAKEHYCDINGSSSLRKSVIVSSLDPTYVNVFERNCRRSLERSTPIYENCRGIRKSDSVEKKSPKMVKKVLNKTRSTSPTSNEGGLIDEEPKLSKPELEKEEKKKEEEKEDEKEEEKGKRVSSKARSKRAPSSNSSLDSVHRSSVGETKNRERDQEADARSLHNRSTRSSRLHRASLLNGGREQKSNPGRESVKRYATNDKKKILNHQVFENETIERLTKPIVKVGVKESNDSSSGR